MHLASRKTVLLATLGISLSAWSFVWAQNEPALPIQVLPTELKWNGDANLHGLQTAPLAGDPKAPAPYAERIRIPAHYRLRPHSHPNEARMVTVISGTLYYAFGDKFDESKLKALPPGSFFTEPKDMPHYAMTKRKEVILQLNAIGPAATKYVDAAESAEK